MIIRGDYDSEMGISWQLDDATAEAVLAGREVCDELEPLRRLLLAYRDTARSPVPPRGELATRMATGAFFPAARRPRRHGVSAERRRVRSIEPRRAVFAERRHAGSSGQTAPPARATSPRRRLRTTVMAGLATAAANLAALSGAAKAAAGVAIVTASLTAAGATGSLPDPAQDRFDSVVDTVAGDESPAPDVPGEDAEFGDRVSEDAKDGGVDGGEVREEAEQQGSEHRPDRVPAPDGAGKPTELPTPDDVPAPPVELPTAGPTDAGAAAPTAPPGR